MRTRRCGTGYHAYRESIDGGVYDLLGSGYIKEDS